MRKVLDPYAKKYRKKLITNIVLITSLVAITGLVIISYIGNLVGNYTIRIDRGTQYLSMADNVEFNNPTSRLRAEMLKGTYPITVDYLPSDEEIESQDGSHNGMVDEINNGRYLAYTFYIRNVGGRAFEYSNSISVEELYQPIDNQGYGLDEILRVRVYENPVEYLEDGTIKTTHNSTTYAKATRHVVDNEGSIPDDSRECVGRYEDDSYQVCAGNNNYRAQQFYSEDMIVYQEEKVLHPNETIRYTIVMWLEGNDPECSGNLPGSSSITLGMKFSVDEILA